MWRLRPRQGWGRRRCEMRVGGCPCPAGGREVAEDRLWSGTPPRGGVGGRYLAERAGVGMAAQTLWDLLTELPTARPGGGGH